MLDLYSNLVPKSQHYDLHLVTLNDDILQTIKNKQGKLFIKAHDIDKGYPVVTTDAKTFKVRLQNQSNTVMLVDLQNEGGLSFDQLPSRLILEEVAPEIPIEGLTVVNSIADFGNFDESHYGLESLFNDSTCSPDQFASLVAERQVLEYKGGCYVVSDEVMTKCLQTLLEKVIKDVIDAGHELEIMDQLNNSITVPELEGIPAALTELCAHKFVREGKINHDLVVRQFALELLERERDLKMDDFLLSVKLRMPFNYTPEISPRRAIRGKYYTYESGTKISYLDEALLTQDASKRFQQLFALKPQWDLEEIEPFVEAVNRRHTKIDKFLMKFCRVKRVGKRRIVERR